jgi:hypothetical protein
MLQYFKWLSVKNILDGIKELFSRFPLVAINTFLATVCGYTLVESIDWVLSDNTQQILTKILLMAVLGFPLLTGLTLVSEKFKLKAQNHWILQIVGVVVLTLYYFALPKDFQNFEAIHVTRLVVFNIVAYLLALSFSFYERGQSLRFWRFTENAFARLVISAFFSFALWAGIALSLAAVDYLFQANIQGETYLKAWIIIVGIFGAWFFLAGFPKAEEHLSEKMEESKFLRIFLQYICVPLLSIFFVILYTYLGKIVILWDWPKGGVADWILGFSSAGFLIYVLSFPLLERKEHPFLKKFFQVFFALVIPMVAVLALAIWFRVSEYGVTESRYLVMLGGIWLLASSLYFFFSKHKELKLLPYLAAGFLFFAVWGPWGMYSVSISSQESHLQNLLMKYHLLENGKAVAIKDENTIPLKDRASIYSKIQYLQSHHGLQPLKAMFPSVKVSTSTLSRYDSSFALDAMKVLNIESYYDYQPSEVNEDYAYLNVDGGRSLDVQGFDTLISNANLYPYQGEPVVQEYLVASSTYVFSLEKNSISVKKDDVLTASVDMSPYLNGWVEKYASKTGVLQQKFSETGEMKIDVDMAEERLRLIFVALSLQKINNVWEIQSVDFQVLIGKK